MLTIALFPKDFRDGIWVLGRKQVHWNVNDRDTPFRLPTA